MITGDDPFTVCFEVPDSGRWMAHVIELPGYMVVAASRDDVLERLPGAVRDYVEWLRGHGEMLPGAEGPYRFRQDAVVRGVGPALRGDEAALFPQDMDPVTDDDLATYLKIAGFNRADLLSLTQSLPDDALDLKSDPEAMSAREILRHVGNAEQWYVSRLVEPETLPPEWQDDERLPIFEFLEMERRTATERLWRLTDEERSALVMPIRWAKDPENPEPWTARKALRRLVEHEREHVSHIREALAAMPVDERAQ